MDRYLKIFNILSPIPCFFSSDSFPFPVLDVVPTAPFPAISRAFLQGFAFPDDPETKRYAQPTGPKRAAPMVVPEPTISISKEGLASVPPSLKGLVNSA